MRAIVATDSALDHCMTGGDVVLANGTDGVGGAMLRTGSDYRVHRPDVIEEPVQVAGQHHLVQLALSDETKGVCRVQHDELPFDMSVDPLPGERQRRSGAHRWSHLGVSEILGAPHFSA